MSRLYCMVGIGLIKVMKYYLQAETMMTSISYGRMIFGEIYLNGLAEEWMVVFSGGEFG